MNRRGHHLANQNAASIQTVQSEDSTCSTSLTAHLKSDRCGCEWGVVWRETDLKSVFHVYLVWLLILLKFLTSADLLLCRHSWNTSVCTQSVSLICHVTSQTKGKVQLVQIYEQSNFQRLHQRAPWHHTSSTSHQLTVWTRSSMLRPDRQNIQFNLKWWERSNKKSSTKSITQTQSEQTKSNMNQIKSHKFTEFISFSSIIRS